MGDLAQRVVEETSLDLMPPIGAPVTSFYFYDIIDDELWHPTTFKIDNIFVNVQVGIVVSHHSNDSLSFEIEVRRPSYSFTESLIHKHYCWVDGDFFKMSPAHRYSVLKRAVEEDKNISKFSARWEGR